MQYIIMCGGKYDKWTEPRQLTEIKGEPLVGRTIRLLREAGVEDIAISTLDKRYERFGVPLLKHESVYTVADNRVAEGFWCSCFYPTKKPACYLFGDVVYSPDAIAKIVGTSTTCVAFFASAPPFAEDYPKRWAEPFAFKVQNQEAFRAGIDRVRDLWERGVYHRHPIAWELWAALTGGPPNVIDFTSYEVINDYTCDIDEAEDVRAWQTSKI